MRAAISVFLCTVIIPGSVLSYNVLLMSPFCSKSHKNSIDPAINELIARGHKITEVAMEVNNNSTGIRQYELQDVRKLLMEQTISSNHNPFAPAEEQENMLTLLYNLTKDTAG